jgi:hypothetical protein
MRFMFWNIRCFGRPARRNIIRDYISSEGLDGIGLQETMKGDFTKGNWMISLEADPLDEFGRNLGATLVAS